MLSNQLIELSFQADFVKREFTCNISNTNLRLLDILLRYLLAKSGSALRPPTTHFQCQVCLIWSRITQSESTVLTQAIVNKLKASVYESAMIIV